MKTSILFNTRPWIFKIKPWIKVCQPNATSHRWKSETFIDGTSSVYLEEMYKKWQKDPNSVDPSWSAYFKSLEQNAPYQPPPAPAFVAKNEVPLLKFIQEAKLAVPSPAPSAKVAAPETDSSITAQLCVARLIKSYGLRGYLKADLDPLKLSSYTETGSPPDGVRDFPALRKPETLDTEFELPHNCYIGGSEKKLKLKEIIGRLENVYCKRVGIEYGHNTNEEQRQWIKKKFETPGAFDLKPEERKLCCDRLLETGGFEAFLAKKWSSEKRFGIEGCDILIPITKTVVDISTALGAEKFIIGMPHRGRLNILCNVCHKPLRQMLAQFHGLQPTEENMGDVKYHLGTAVEVVNSATKKKINLVVVANPSHLEAVDPVVQGKCRAEQFFLGDKDRKKVIPILFHGDASFCGQGVVYETIHLSNLPNYTTGGTVHIVCNNQIGFTTNPRLSRSSPFCTDVAKVINAPIFHVNAEDPDSAIVVAKAAAEYRNRFGLDVVIDIVGYRRNGHNEADEPMFTNPFMYRKIRALVPIWQTYAKKLVDEGVITQNEVDKKMKDYDDMCQKEFEISTKEKHIRFSDWLDSPWKGWSKVQSSLKIAETGVKEEILRHIGEKFSAKPPGDFEIHNGLERILVGRQKMVQARTADWALGEAFAWGSLLKEGIHVRLSGEDVERGTFSHRHHVMHHQSKDKTTYCAMTQLWPDQAEYHVCNSSLSEFGVMGFEVGYSLTNPKSLVMWEGQFGDFYTTGQTIVDTFISSGEQKWVRQSGFVMLLPHAMEGMGPEHSCAHPERFLQMCDDDADLVPDMTSPDFVAKQLRDINWIVANVTVPGNYFHIMRRQIAMPFRKPLVLFTPKSLLRHPEAKSSFDEMLEGTAFRRVIPEEGEASKSPENVKLLVFCSGKVYFELKAERKKRNLDKVVALERLEQLCPFPYDVLKEECEKYPKATLKWAQEEHKNFGCWEYVFPRMNALLQYKRPIVYAGRSASASPATGNKFQHTNEIKKMYNDVFAGA